MSNRIKYCVVKTCRNNSRLCPKKIFLSTKPSWYAVIGREDLSKNSCFFICEDHFNLKQDSTNWLAYSRFSKLLRLKKDIVPHLFIDTPSTVPFHYSQLQTAEQWEKEQLEKEALRGEFELNVSPHVEIKLLQGDNATPCFEMEYSESEDPLKLDDSETPEDLNDNPYNFLELSFSPEVINNEEIIEDENDSKPNVQELDIEMAKKNLQILPETSNGRHTEESEEEKSMEREDNINIFLKYLATKLKRIEDETSYDKAEIEIINVAHKYLNRTKNNKFLVKRSTGKIIKRNVAKLRIIKNDHNYGRVLWMNE